MSGNMATCREIYMSWSESSEGGSDSTLSGAWAWDIKAAYTVTPLLQQSQPPSSATPCGQALKPESLGAKSIQTIMETEPYCHSLSPPYSDTLAPPRPYYSHRAAPLSSNIPYEPMRIILIKPPHSLIATPPTPHPSFYPVSRFDDFRFCIQFALCNLQVLHLCIKPTVDWKYL